MSGGHTFTLSSSSEEDAPITNTKSNHEINSESTSESESESESDLTEHNNSSSGNTIKTPKLKLSYFEKKTLPCVNGMWSTFTYPIKDSIISLCLENQKTTMERVRRNTRKTVNIIGRITHILMTEAFYVRVRGEYLDSHHFPDKIAIREDDLYYIDYGCKKKWYVRFVRHENENEEHNEKRKLLQQLNALKEYVNIDVNVYPLRRLYAEEKKEVDEGLTCEVCKKANDPHPEYGSMVICDACNKGYHQECHISRIGKVSEKYHTWYCDECKKKRSKR